MIRSVLGRRPRLPSIAFRSMANSNNSNSSEIRLSQSEIFSERPMEILRSTGFNLIILNGALESKDLMVRDNFERLWTQSIYRVAVDGGLKALFDLDRGSPSVFIPHTVCGDMDSVNTDVLDEYKDIGVEIVPTVDQNKTDFTKAIELVLGRIEEKLLPDDKATVVLGSSRMDRADHQLAMYHTLLQAANRSSLPLYLIQDNSMVRVLKRGFYRLRVDTGFESGIIGLFPLGGATQVFTTGLRWNIDGPLEFGKIVSSSNRIESEVVEVTTDGPLILTMGIGRPQSKCCGGGCS